MKWVDHPAGNHRRADADLNTEGGGWVASAVAAALAVASVALLVFTQTTCLSVPL